MATAVKTQKKASAKTSSTGNKDVAMFIGELFSFNSSLKLYHWNITGQGSYAQHMALDQAIDSLLDVIDRLTETTIAMKGDVMVSVPETKAPKDIIKHARDFYAFVEKQRKLLPEDFSQSILDDYQEGIQQLLYRLVRLK